MRSSAGCGYAGRVYPPGRGSHRRMSLWALTYSSHEITPVPQLVQRDQPPDVSLVVTPKYAESENEIKRQLLFLGVLRCMRTSRGRTRRSPAFGTLPLSSGRPRAKPLNECVNPSVGEGATGERAAAYSRHDEEVRGKVQEACRVSSSSQGRGHWTRSFPRMGGRAQKTITQLGGAAIGQRITRSCFAGGAHPPSPLRLHAARRHRQGAEAVSQWPRRSRWPNRGRHGDDRRLAGAGGGRSFRSTSTLGSRAYREPRNAVAGEAIVQDLPLVEVDRLEQAPPMPSSRRWIWFLRWSG